MAVPNPKTSNPIPPQAAEKIATLTQMECLHCMEKFELLSECENLVLHLQSVKWSGKLQGRCMSQIGSIAANANDLLCHCEQDLKMAIQTVAGQFQEAREGLQMAKTTEVCILSVTAKLVTLEMSLLTAI